MKLPSVAIIILNWNGLKDTLECLESVFKNTYSNYFIYVVDNASEKNELAEIKNHYQQRKNIFFIQNASNLGFAEGNNIGIRKAIQAGAEWIFTLNNDTVVDPEFLTETVKCILHFSHEHAPIGIVSTTMLRYHDRTKIDSIGHDLLTTGDTIPRCRGNHWHCLKANEANEANEAVLFGACAGAALYSVEMLRQIGLFDPDFFLNYEDADLSLRAIVRGWRVVSCPASIIYHKGNVSIKKIKNTAYRIRSQRNMLWAYLHNIPLPVILINLPWIIIRDMLAVFASILFFQWGVTKILVLSRWQVLRSFPVIIKKRRLVLSHQRVSSFWLWRNQRSWIPVYLRYLTDILLKRRF